MCPPRTHLVERRTPRKVPSSFLAAACRPLQVHACCEVCHATLARRRPGAEGGSFSHPRRTRARNRPLGRASGPGGGRSSSGEPPSAGTERCRRRTPDEVIFSGGSPLRPTGRRGPHGARARRTGGGGRGPTAHPPCGNFRAYTYLHEKGSQITRCIALGATRGVYHTHTHTHFAKRERRPRPARRWQRRRASRRPSRRRQSSVA